MGNAGALTRDLVQRTPGQSLIEKLMSEWDAGRIRVGEHPDQVVIDEDARGWYWGVLGERRVAERLSALGSQWTVLHSVPIGTGTTDVDHVAIGPSGVYTINTKYSSGAKVWVAGRGLYVNGTSQAQYLRKAMVELTRATKLLSEAAGFAVPVYSAVVFVAPHSLTTKAPPGWDGVTLEVMPDHELPALATRRREMSDEQLTRVLDVALLPGTWHRTPRDTQPGDHYAKEFDALRAAVGPGLEVTREVTTTRPVVRRASVARTRNRTTSRAPRRGLGERLLVGCLGAIAVPVLGYLALTWAMQLLLQR